MKTYQLSPELISKLTDMRERPDAPRRYDCPHRNSDDVLNQRLWQYYAKPKYYSRTSKCYGGTWATPWPPVGQPCASRSDRPYYADGFGGLRTVGFCDEVTPRRVRHRGWNMDPYADFDDTARGMVLQLPARDGSPRYVPAVQFGESEGVTIFPLCITDDKYDAADRADDHARQAAEEEKERRTKQYVEASIADLHADNKRCIARVRDLKRGLRFVDYLSPSLCDVMRSEIRSLRHMVTSNIEEIKKLRDNPWVLFERRCGC